MWLGWAGRVPLFSSMQKSCIRRESKRSEEPIQLSHGLLLWWHGTVVVVHFQTDIFASLAHFFSDTSVHFDKLSEKS